MNKTESSQLTIGSRVFADGTPRQVCCITTKKVGFKRGNYGHRDFYRFDQLSGIPTLNLGKDEREMQRGSLTYHKE